MLKLASLTFLALVAFAANSVLARLALQNNNLDPTGFTLIRLVSGTIMLFILVFMLQSKTKNNHSKGSWLSGLMLFIYAAAFSFAYVILDTATGALILFGAVQITMIVVSVLTGQKLALGKLAGTILSFGGFIYLVLPNIGTPSMLGFGLMSAAGIAWGFYTLNGRKSVNPLADTAYNFLRSLPFVALLTIIYFSSISATSQGIIYATISGAITSGIGYAIWYKALKDLHLSTAAVVQLSVPIIAAIGGVLLVNEQINLRLVISATLILGGILLVIFTPRKS